MHTTMQARLKQIHAESPHIASQHPQATSAAVAHGKPAVDTFHSASGLSTTMQQVVDWMKSHGGTITRYPGGFWWIENATGKTVHQAYGTSTVQALVRRGVAEYCEWKGNAAGRFPIKARLRKL